MKLLLYISSLALGLSVVGVLYWFVEIVSEQRNVDTGRVVPGRKR